MDAVKTAKRAKEFLPKIQDRAQRIAVLIEVAPILAAGGALADVRAELSTAEAKAAKLGYGALRLEVQLAEVDVIGILSPLCLASTLWRKRRRPRVSD